MMQPNQKLQGLAGLTLCLGLVSAAIFKPVLEQAALETANNQEERLKNIPLNEYDVIHDQGLYELIGATLTSSQLDTLRSSVVFHWSENLLIEMDDESDRPCKTSGTD